MQSKKMPLKKRKVTIAFSPEKRIEKNQQVLFNGGYLFLQAIYYALGLDSIAKTISKKHKFTFNLNFILSNLLYARVSDDFTDLLHEKFQLQTDRQIITSQEMKNILKRLKIKKHYSKNKKRETLSSLCFQGF